MSQENKPAPVLIGFLILIVQKQWAIAQRSNTSV